MNDEKNYLSLTHFLSKSLFLGIGLSKILINTKESTIFSLILGTVLGIIILFFINKFKNNNNIISFILIYILFIVNLAEFVNLITSIYLMDMNRFVIIIPLLILILYMNTKSISVHFKVSKILLIITMFLFFIGYIVLIPCIDYLNYLPLYNVSFKNILLSSFQFALYSSVPIIVYNNIDYNINKKNKKIIINYLLSCLVLIFIFLIVQGVLGIELINIFKYPEYVIFKRINLLNFIQNIENILSFFWLIISITYLSITSKIMYDIINKTFNKKYIYPIFLIISLFFISNYLFDSLEFLLFLYNYLWLILLLVLVIYFLTSIIIKIYNYHKN